MDELRNEILSLTASLEQKKKQLFAGRLEKIHGKSNTISDLVFDVDPIDHTWSISYTHTTDQYDANSYTYEVSDGNSSDEDIRSKRLNNSPRSNKIKTMKITQISFGKLKKYFIKGGTKFNIYRNSNGELRIINLDYEFELDLEEQKSLIRRYSIDKNLPEWLAIKVFLYISDNKWDDQSIINHLSDI